MAINKPIQWANIKVKLGNLKPWDDNPRQSTKAQAKALLESFEEFGQVQTVAVGPKLQVYDGHQRLSALLAVHGKNYTVDARQSSRALTRSERQRLVLTLHAKAQGEFNWDKLAGWDESTLINGGLDAAFLDQLNRSALALTALLHKDDEDAGEDNEDYTSKIEAPIYTIKGQKPELGDLFDNSHTVKLINEIQASDVPDDVKSFLTIAATRHTVLHFKRIAEYYAHSPAEVQRLMENNALVIIDFNRAIELGYIELSEDLTRLYEKDYGSQSTNGKAH